MGSDEDGERDEDGCERERRPDREEAVATNRLKEPVVVGSRDLARIPDPAAGRTLPTVSVANVGDLATVARKRDRRLSHESIVT